MHVVSIIYLFIFNKYRIGVDWQDIYGREKLTHILKALQRYDLKRETSKWRSYSSCLKTMSG